MISRETNVAGGIEMQELANKKLHIGILTNIPAPYRKPMWEAYAKIPNTEFDIYYCAPIESDRKWKVPKAEGVREIFLRGRTFKRSAHLNLEIIKLARRYDLWLIGGYSMPTAQLLIILCKLFRIPYVVIFDGISPLKIDMRENPLKLIWKRFLVKGCFAWLGNGTVGKLYAKKLGIPEDRVFNQYLTVDVDRFKSFLPEKKQLRLIKRKELGIPEEAFVILYIGRLVKHKGVQDLIKTFEELAFKNETLYLLIVGHGDYEEELKRISDNHPRIIFTGNIEYERIHEAYFLSDLFVLPTYDDPWGLVINEALACELPVITTTASGASLEIIDKRLVVDPGDKAVLAKRIKEALEGKYDEAEEEPLGYWSFDMAAESSQEVINRFRASRKGGPPKDSIVVSLNQPRTTKEAQNHAITRDKEKRNH